MNRWLNLGLFLLVLVAFTLGQKPLTVGKLDAVVRISGHAPTYQKIYVPQNTEMQAVIGIQSYAIDDYGNRYLKVIGDFDIRFKVSVDSRRLIIAKDEPLAPSATTTEYLESTSLINADNPTIRALAKSITKDSKTKLEAITKLTLWVNRYLTYDEKYADTYLSSIEALEMKKGVCDEYTNLYAAMTRSLGIPTRIVVGLVYTGSRWNMHAWAESYVSGQWIPADPTFAEVGQIDATHIVIYRGPNYPFFVSPSTTLSYTIESPEFMEYDLNLDVKPHIKEVLSPREIFQVHLEIKNNENFIVTPTYLLQTTDGFDMIDNPRKTLILYPREVKNISWRLVAPFGERDEYYIGLVGPRIDELFELRVSRGEPKFSSDFDIVEAFYYTEGKNLVIQVTLKNTGNKDIDGATISVSSQGLGAKSKTFNLAVGEEKKITVEFPVTAGNYLFHIQASYENASKDTYLMANILEESGKEEKDLLNSMIQYLSQHSTGIFLIAVGAIISIAVIIFLSSHTPRKPPFKGTKKWKKLLKLERR